MKLSLLDPESMPYKYSSACTSCLPTFKSIILGFYVIDKQKIEYNFEGGDISFQNYLQMRIRKLLSAYVFTKNLL